MLSLYVLTGRERAVLSLYVLTGRESSVEYVCVDREREQC